MSARSTVFLGFLAGNSYEVVAAAGRDSVVVVGIIVVFALVLGRFANAP